MNYMREELLQWSAGSEITYGIDTHQYITAWLSTKDYTLQAYEPRGGGHTRSYKKPWIDATGMKSVS